MMRTYRNSGSYAKRLSGVRSLLSLNRYRTILFDDILYPTFPANNVMIMIKTAKSPSFILLAAASIALTLGVAACNKNPTPDNSAQSQPAQTDQSQDPAAAANLAPASERSEEHTS